jgi:hypothetical protein
MKPYWPRSCHLDFVFGSQPTISTSPMMALLGIASYAGIFARGANFVISARAPS